uniref:Uncharacterized protein n=1 Tax=Arundo donax TaxID=35708 RepID=A0A0A8ZYS7_ARUDO
MVLIKKFMRNHIIGCYRASHLDYYCRLREELGSRPSVHHWHSSFWLHSYSPLPCCRGCVKRHGN